MFTFKALNNQVPSYTSDLIGFYVPKRTLGSQSSGLMVVEGGRSIRPCLHVADFFKTVGLDCCRTD